MLKFAKIYSQFYKSVCRSPNVLRQEKLLILFARTNVDEIDPRGIGTSAILTVFMNEREVEVKLETCF